ncbi:MAG: PAS domain-containing protein [Desulfobacter sp.]|nr:MAG: PAS domain-containing protein [Desulfobacter sp.]
MKNDEEKKSSYNELEDKVRHLEQLIRRERSWNNTLIDTISSPIFYKDRRGLYRGCNKAFEEFIGRPRSEIIGKTVYDLGPRELADTYAAKDRELFESPGKQRYEFKVKTAGGECKDVIFDKATLCDSRGEVTGLVGVISDITEQKNSQKIIQNLSQMLIQAQERERYMISCELHDSIAQNLSILKLSCTRMFKNMAELTPGIQCHIEDAYRLIDQTIQSVRGLAQDLRPSSLDLLGLVHSVEVFCEEFSEKHDIFVDFQTAGMNGMALADDVEINLYRIVQEGLNNIRKHARATEAVVRLIGARPHIILHIEDNGRGFDVKERERETVKEKRMGIWSMQARARLIQGRMAVTSRLNGGTKITVKLERKKQ